MRRWRLPIIYLVLVVLAAVAIRHIWKKHEEKKREIFYQSVLHSYSEDLKPGMTREQVENFLRAKKDQFQQVCCDRGSYSDLIKIGQEDAPWYCSENNIYIAFQFNSVAEESAHPWKDPFDPLESIELLPKLEDCL